MNRLKALWQSVKDKVSELELNRFYLVEFPDKHTAKSQFCIINPLRCICLFAIQKHSFGDVSIIILNAELFIGRDER